MVIKNHLTITSPVELARLMVSQRTLVATYETNPIIKALGTWLVLKAESRYSLIQRWNLQKQWLFTLCKCRENSFRNRLKLLEEMKLITIYQGNIKLCSWQTLGKLLELDISNKFNIEYDIRNSQTVHEWIIATEIRDNQSRQAYKIMQKLNKNPSLITAVVHEMIHQGADKSKVNDPAYILSWLKIMYINDFKKASEIHDVLIEVRPDTNRGVKGMADAWKCKSPLTVCYWKRKLQKSGIIDVGKIQVQSEERVRNKECTVLWLKNTKQTLLCLCDQITVLTPWLYKDMEKLLAA